MNTNEGQLNISVGIDNARLRAEAEETSNILRNIGKTATQQGAAMDNAFIKAAAAAGSFFAVAQAKEFINQIIRTRAEIQSLEVSFETLLGNKQKAAEMFGELRKFAVETPMMLKDLAGGAQTMLAFNLEAEKVMPMLRAIGDISMGDAQKFNSLTLAFSQMSSTGRLMGQDLLQMINAGFNPLAVISEKTGKTIGELKKEMEAGKISSEMITDAFLAAASAGGKFNGMLEKQSHGIAGAQAKLSGAIDDMFNAIGQSSEEIIVGAYTAAGTLAKNYKAVGEVIAAVVATYGIYKAALITITAIERARVQLALAQMEGLTKVGAVTEILTAKTEALNAAMSKNVWGIVAAAVAALAYGIYKIATSETEAEKATKRLDEVSQEYNKTCAAEQVRIDTLFSRLQSAKKGTQEYKQAKDAILSQYGSYLKGLSSEVASLNDVAGAYKAIKTAALEAARARSLESATTGAADAYGKVEGEQLGKLETLLKEKFGGLKDKNGKLLWTTHFATLKGIIQDGGGIDNVSADFRKVFDEVKYQAGGGTLATGSSYANNDLENIFEAIGNAKAIYDKEIHDADAKFGKAPTKSTTEEKAAPKWSDDVKAQRKALADAQADLARLKKDANATTEAVKEAQSRVDAAEKALNDLGVKTSSENKAATKASNVAQDNADKLADNANKRIEQEAAYARQVADAVKETEFEIEQARIDAMEEGVAKELAQNELNYKRLQEQQARRQREMLDELAEHKIREQEAANPTMFMKKNSDGKWEDDSATRDAAVRSMRATLTVKDLSDEQQAQIQELAQVATKLYEKANRDSLKRMLNEVMDYTQQRAKIEADYAERREQLYTTDAQGNKVLHNGVTQGNVDELNRQETEALASVDEQFAQRSETYKAWCQQIAQMSLEQLNKALKEAQEALAAMDKSGANPQALATARAKVNTLQKTVNAASAKEQLSPGTRTIKEWEDLYNALCDVEREFESIGDAVGGTAGEIISAAGQIATSTLKMINGIVTLANSSIAATQASAQGASKAVSAVEKASVILAIVSAAMQIAMTIYNIFQDSKQEKFQKEMDALQGRMESLQWVLDNMDVERVWDQYGKSVDRVNSALAATRLELLANQQGLQAINTLTGYASQNTTLMQGAVAKLADAYASMGYTADKAMGEERYASARKQMENLAEQQLLLAEQNEKLSDQKDVDQDKINDNNRKIEELGQKVLSVINEMVEEIIGSSASDIAQELGDAFIEAFAAGEDAAKAWGDKVNDIVRDILKRMLIQKFLEGPIGEIFNKYKQQWFKEGSFAGIDAVTASMGNFKNDLNGALGGFQAVMNSLPEEVKAMIMKSAEDSRSAAEGSIASASQESIDELNGRATAIQSHTYSISENTKLLLSTTQNILQSVMHIETETEGFGARLGRMENNIKAMANSIDDIATKGIRLKN